jgi:hypothetical protein
VVVAGVVNSNVVRPARNRRRIEQLEVENERLDALLARQPRKETDE